MDAAVKVFTGKGIAATTVSDIAQAAGVAKGTFYLYFDSKEQLLAALRKRFVGELMDHALPFLTRIGREDWADLGANFIASMVTFCLDHRDSILVFNQDAHTASAVDILAETDRRLTDMIATGIRAGVEAGAYSTSDPDLAAAFLFNAIEGTIIRKIVYGEPIDRDHIVAVIQELTRKMLAPDPVPSAAGTSSSPTLKRTRTRRAS
jgi:AcrR family transcriptional regulator